MMASIFAFPRVTFGQGESKTSFANPYTRPGSIRSGVRAFASPRFPTQCACVVLASPTMRLNPSYLNLSANTSAAYFSPDVIGSLK